MRHCLLIAGRKRVQIKNTQNHSGIGAHLRRRRARRHARRRRRQRQRRQLVRLAGGQRDLKRVEQARDAGDHPVAGDAQLAHRLPDLGHGKVMLGCCRGELRARPARIRPEARQKVQLQRGSRIGCARTAMSNKAWRQQGSLWSTGVRESHIPSFCLVRDSCRGAPGRGSWHRRCRWRRPRRCRRATRKTAAAPAAQRAAAAAYSARRPGRGAPPACAPLDQQCSELCRLRTGPCGFICSVDQRR